MIRLLINGLPAIPKRGSSIKIVAENPYFTKAAAYTYDVELPMAIAENRRIFGQVHRLDMDKRRMEMDAELESDGVRILTGKAILASVTDSAVTVQLLGGESAYNNSSKTGDLYVDELDMGPWYLATWPDGSWYEPRKGTWNTYPADHVYPTTADSVFQRAGWNEDGTWSMRRMTERIMTGLFPWVALPTKNSSADIVCNNYCYKFMTSVRDSAEMHLRSYVGERKGERIEEPVVASDCIQPFIWFMCRKVAEATGFTLEDAENVLRTDGFLNRIYMVNTGNFMAVNKVMPHWTVNEWWTQIENTFGVMTCVDYSSKKMKIMLRKDYYRSGAPVVCLRNVVEQYTAEIDSDTHADLSVSNVGFAGFENDPEDLLSEFILENAVVEDRPGGINELQQWAAEQEAEKLSEMKDRIFRCADGRQFIYTDSEGFVEVNMFRPRLVDESKKDPDIELKFVPARFIDGACDIYDYPRSPAGDKPVGSFPVRLIEAPGISDMAWYQNADKERIDIESILAGEAEEKRSGDTGQPDLAYMAILPMRYDQIRAKIHPTNGSWTYSDTFIWPRAWLRERTKAAVDGDQHIEDSGMSLGLNEIKGQINLALFAVGEESAAIDTTIRHCIRFISHRLPDVGAIFLIRGKRYVCEKIEAGITEAGLDRMITGYFYRLEL